MNSVYLITISFYFQKHLSGKNLACVDLFLYFIISRYNSLAAYGQSKLANVLHANELARRLKVHDLFMDIVLLHHNF